jgi:hypothetical protein
MADSHDSVTKEGMLAPRNNVMRAVFGLLELFTRVAHMASMLPHQTDHHHYDNCCGGAGQYHVEMPEAELSNKRRIVWRLAQG